MAWADGRIRAPALLVATVVGIGIVASCDHDRTTAPARAPTAAVATVDATPNPEQGCWVYPDTAVIDPLDEGGMYPYTAPRCGVNVSLAWPGFVSQDGFTYTHIRGGASQTPWLHFPGSLGLTPPAGWPWTITFDRAVRNIRVYTRWAEFAGGKVVVQGPGGVILAERAIPLSPTYFPGTSTPTGIVDTLSFPDTNVYSVRIIPALDPNNPNDPGEFLAWQAQFDTAAAAQGPPECPPSNDAIADSARARAFFRDMLDSAKAFGPESARREAITRIWYNTALQKYAFNYATTAPNPTKPITPCHMEVIMPGSPGAGYVLVAWAHTHNFANETPYSPADTFPTACGSDYAGRKSTTESEPSNTDWNTGWDMRVPGYIVGPRVITKFRSDTAASRDPNNRASLKAFWYWNTLGCRWSNMRPPPA